VTEQLTRPLVLFNAENIATAANAAGFNVTPDMLIRRAPLGKQQVVREMTLQQRAETMSVLVRNGFRLSQESELDHFDYVRAVNDDDVIPGEAQTVARGGTLKTTKDAVDGDAHNPDPAAEAKAKGGGGGSGSTPASAPPPSP
jgi:hypothetical protein